MGVATAYYLAEMGHDIVVIEKESGAAEGATHANGGVVHASGVEPWAHPGMPSQLIRSLGREDSPVLLRLSAIPRMWRWGIRFLSNCREAPAHRHAQANARLALLSFESFEEIRSKLSIEYGFKKPGALKIFHDTASLEAAEATFTGLADTGLAFERLSKEEAMALEPGLRSTEASLVGALFFPDEEVGDPNLFTKSLATNCESMGATFHYGESVQSLQTSGETVTGVVTDKGLHRADAYVVAMGAHTGVLLRTLGLPVWIYPVKGVTVTVACPGWREAPTRPIIDGNRFFGLVPMGVRMRCSGFAEVGNFDPRPNRARCEALVRNVASVFPEFKDCYDPDKAIYWGGLRPATPTGTPYLGVTHISNLYVNAGHTQMGWTQGCGSGRVVADLVSGKDSPIRMEGLSVHDR